MNKPGVYRMLDLFIRLGQMSGIAITWFVANVLRSPTPMNASLCQLTRHCVLKMDSKQA